MQGLYKKVVKGNYPKIPKTFSKDLNNLIKSMLQVNPNQRPGCAELLSMPSILSRAKRLCPAIYIEQMEKPDKSPK
jgi:NIMA (never in mitosis gene a)-related kinase